jgi:hypothetical protein
MKKETTSKIRDFVNKWKNKGNEKQDTHPFWEGLVECLLGVQHGYECLDWEQKIPKRAIVEENGENPKFLDCYLKTSRCVIEQKSYKISLDEKRAIIDGKPMNALQQAQWYYDNMNRPDDGKKGRYTIACNFQEFRIFDNNHGDTLYETLRLEDLPRRWPYLRRVLIGGEASFNDNVQDAAAKTASGFVSKLYDLLQKQYKKEELTKEVLHQLNVFCVRVVFCLYADDEEIFDDSQFHTFLNTFSAKQLNNKFKWLFIALDKEKRPDSYDPEILAFPRVNGGLFKNEVPIPRISEEVKDLLLKASKESQMNGKESFDWSEISPTNFGCIFESTLDPVTREENGMHYTSPENIHRVIDPLFLDDLQAELNGLLDLPNRNKKEKEARYNALQKFQNKIAKLHFLDPACGSGNFLTETFKSLRRLEMKVIGELPNLGLGDDALKKDGIYLKNPCKVNIRQFYGIEINDFAVQVANTALWISDCQMIAEAEELFSVSIPALPLKQNDNIRCGNALETNWEKIVNPRSLDYIIGNPPFLGSQRMNKTQKKELKAVLSAKDGRKSIWKAVGAMDYICGWYVKAAEYMQKNKKTMAALVSTNSITQGEQVAMLWEPLVTHYNLRISFARRTIKWDNAAEDEANVHFIVVGFYCQKTDRGDDKYIYAGDEKGEPVKHINGYLLPAEDIFLHPKLKHIQSDAPVMRLGSMPNDGEREARKQAKELAQKRGKAYNPSEIRGKLRLSKNEKDSLTTNYPELMPYIRRILGAEDFISGTENYCIWMREDEDCPLPSDIINHPALKDRFDFIREVRKHSTRPQTQVLQYTPYLFGEDRQPNVKYLLVPSTSSENRRYVPMGYVEPNIICSNLALTIANCSLYHFGVLTSSLHMAWMKFVCGRLEMRFRYSASLVYNLFPWPDAVTEELKIQIETAAQHILDVREQLGESYEKMYATNMNSKLVKAHLDNDAAVLKAYGFDASWAKDIENHETDIALELMRRSVDLAKKAESSKRKRKVKKSKIRKDEK